MQSATSSEDEGAEATDLAIKDEERDPETYDDSEFYQTLLKEFLEEKQDSAGVNWYTVSAGLECGTWTLLVM